MENIINRILELDKQTRKMALDSNELKVNADKEIKEKTKEITQNYKIKAEQKIEKIIAEETEFLEKKLKQKEQDIKKSLNKLDEKFVKHKDEWVTELTHNTLHRQNL